MVQAQEQLVREQERLEQELRTARFIQHSPLFVSLWCQMVLLSWMECVPQMKQLRERKRDI
jgi:hypothetical protein